MLMILLGGRNTISMHNTCEDSLLATPLIIDLIVLCELCERISVKRTNESDDKYERFHSVLSLLSYLMKAPLVPPGTPIINALNAQRQCLVNVFRACVGLPPENFMLLEHKIPSQIRHRVVSQQLAMKMDCASSGSASSASIDSSVVSASTTPPLDGNTDNEMESKS